MGKYRRHEDTNPSSPDLPRKYPQATLNSFISLKKQPACESVHFIDMERAYTGKRKDKMPDGKEIKNLLCLEEKGSGLGLTVNGKETIC